MLKQLIYDIWKSSGHFFFNINGYCCDAFDCGKHKDDDDMLKIRDTSVDWPNFQNNFKNL